MNQMQVNEPAAAAAAILTGAMAILDLIPPVAAAVSSISGAVLVIYLIKYRIVALKKEKIDTEISSIELENLKKGLNRDGT